MPFLCLPLSHETDPKENRLPTRTKLCYSLGHIWNDCCSALWFTYLLVFFQYVLKMESADAGALLLIGQIVDGVTTPLVGMQVGRRQGRLCCFGKPYKGWHIAGSICVLASFPFLFLPCLGCESYGRLGLLVWYGGFVVLAQVGWAIVQISHMALIPILASTDSERVEISAYKNAAGFIACVVVYVTAWLIFGLQAGVNAVDTTSASQFMEISTICHGLGIVCSLIFWIGLKEPSANLSLESAVELSNHPVEKKRNKYGHWFTKPAFYTNIIIFTSGRLFGNLTQAYLPMYLQMTLSLPPITIATVPLTLYICGFMTSMSVKWLEARTSHSLLLWAAVTLGFASSAAIWFCDGYVFTTYLIYLVAASFGAAGSLIYIISLASTANMIGEDSEASGFVYGLYSFSDKIINGVVVFIIQYLHPARDSALTDDFYRWVLSLSCTAALVLTLATQIADLARSKGNTLQSKLVLFRIFAAAVPSRFKQAVNTQIELQDVLRNTISVHEACA